MDMQDAAASFMRLKEDDEEAVPHDLFGRDMETMEIANTQGTIRALKFALKHPLTNDRVVKMGNYARPTAATIAQRHMGKSNAMSALEKLLNSSHDLSETDGGLSPVGRLGALEESGLFTGKVTAGSKTKGGEPVSNRLYSHGYSRERTKKYSGIKPGGDVEGTPMNITLQQIEEVLDGLNEGMRAIQSSYNHPIVPCNGSCGLCLWSQGRSATCCCRRRPETASA